MILTFKRALFCAALIVAVPSVLVSAQDDNEDKFKPRVYGGQPTQTKTVSTAAPTSVPTVMGKSTDIAPTKTVVPAKTPATKPKWPLDLSKFYTGYEGPVPEIVDPNICGKNPLELRVAVDNVKDTEGVIVADLHNDSREDFLVGEKTVVRIRAVATKGRTTFCMPLPAPGDYAVAIFHDKNGNEKFDKGFLGIPKERFGMSTNPKFGTSAPDYDESIFTVGEESIDIQINLVKATDIL